VAAHRKTTGRPFCGKATAIPFGYATRATLLPFLIYPNETRPMTINGEGQFSPDADHQRLVNERFHDRAQCWEQVYQREDLFSVIHQHRQARALDWIDGLALPAGSQVLEVGPGAGFMTVELARRGFVVKAADSTPRMIEIAGRRVAEAADPESCRARDPERLDIRIRAVHAVRLARDL
jgi:SAM-dependent methyltransferase